MRASEKRASKVKINETKIISDEDEKKKHQLFSKADRNSQ